MLWTQNGFASADYLAELYSFALFNFPQLVRAENVKTGEISDKIWNSRKTDRDHHPAIYIVFRSFIANGKILPRGLIFRSNWNSQLRYLIIIIDLNERYFEAKWSLKNITILILVLTTEGLDTPIFRYWSPSVTLVGFTFLLNRSLKFTFKAFMKIKKNTAKTIVAPKTKGQK